MVQFGVIKFLDFTLEILMSVKTFFFLAPEDGWIAETCQAHGCILVVSDGNVIKVF